jgi:hypothetical protein
MIQDVVQGNSALVPGLNGKEKVKKIFKKSTVNKKTGRIKEGHSSKEKKKTIQTTKSLILAQDER